MPSLTSSTVPTSSTSSSCRSAASISRRRMSLISPGRSVVSVGIRVAVWGGCFEACEKYHKRAGQQARGAPSRPARFWHQAKRFGTRLWGLCPHLVPMSGTIRDFKLWQESVALAGETGRVMRQTSRRETKVVSDELMLTAVSVAELVADGHARYTPIEQRQLYRAAKRALLRLETQLAAARHAELINVAVQADLLARVQMVQRLLGGYLVYLERQLDDASAAVKG